MLERFRSYLPFGQQKAASQAASKPSYANIMEILGLMARSMRASGVKRSVQEQAAIGITYACLQRRAQSISSSWEKVYSERTQSDKKEVPLDHWLVRLLWKPNAYYTRSQIRKLTAYWLDINGNAFIHTPIVAGKPTSMWVLRPSRVKIILDSTSLVAGYEVQNSGSSVLVPANEMIHLRDLYASDADEYQVYGRGIIQALKDQLSLDSNLGQYLARFFDNDARPPFVAKIAGDFDGDWQAFKNEWNTNNPNMKLRGLLTDGMEFEEMKSESVKVDFGKVTLSTQEQITSIMGVPLGLITGNLANRSTAEVLERHFYTNTIDPILDYIDEEFTRHFAQFEPSLLVEHEPYRVIDPEMELKREQHEIMYGIKTVNDARKERGKESVEYGDKPLAPKNLTFLEALVPPPAPAPTSAPAPEPDKPKKQLPKKHLPSPNQLSLNWGDNAPEESSLLAYWKSYDEKAGTFTDAVKGELNSVMDDLETTTLDNLEKGLFVPEEWAASMSKRVQEAMQKHIETITAAALGDANAEPEDLSATFDERMAVASQESTDLITGIFGTAKEELQAKIAANTQASTEELQAIVSEYFTQFPEYRSERIARTTATFLTSRTQRETWDEVGQSYRWLTMRDGSVRDDHIKADGQKPDENGFFVVGGEKTLHPAGAGLSAKNAVGCRCTLFPDAVE